MVHPRVVSLVPSATETLCLVGGSELLVGRSHECDFPAKVLDRPILTGQRTAYSSPAQVDTDVRAAHAAGQSLYTLDTEAFERLAPDLVLSQDLCSVCSIDTPAVHRTIAAMPVGRRPEVLSLDPHSLEGVLDTTLAIGQAAGLARNATKALAALRERLHTAADVVAPYVDGPRTVVIEWTDPLFVAGHWTPQLIELAGCRCPLNPTEPLPGAGAGMGSQILHRTAGPSVQITPEALTNAAPEALVVCPCGVGLSQTRREVESLCRQQWWRSLPAVREGRVALVDGSQMFSRPGPRLVDAFEWLVAWIHGRPERIPPGFPWSPWRSANA